MRLYNVDPQNSHKKFMEKAMAHRVVKRLACSGTPTVAALNSASTDSNHRSHGSIYSWVPTCSAQYVGIHRDAYLPLDFKQWWDILREA